MTNTKRGLKRIGGVVLGAAIALALLGTTPWYSRDVLWVVYEDGAKHGWVVGPDTEELSCIKGDEWEIGDPIVVDRNACPHVVSMGWGTLPPFYRDPVGLFFFSVFFGVPLFFAGRWAIRGFGTGPDTCANCHLPLNGPGNMGCLHIREVDAEDVRTYGAMAPREAGRAEVAMTSEEFSRELFPPEKKTP